MKLREEERMLRSRASAARERLESSRARLEYLHERVLQLEHGQAIYQEKLDRSGGEDHESLNKYMDLRRQSGAIEAELTQAREELSVMERNVYSKYQRALADLQRLIEQRFARGRG
jgi:chromosome segregation ATPase